MAALATSTKMSVANLLLRNNVAETNLKGLDQQQTCDEDNDEKQEDTREISTIETDSRESQESTSLPVEHIHAISSSSEDITGSLADEHLGMRLRTLRVDDFDLLKTLGTGRTPGNVYLDRYILI